MLRSLALFEIVKAIENAYLEEVAGKLEEGTREEAC